jgi:hypothetical protein
MFEEDEHIVGESGSQWVFMLETALASAAVGVSRRLSKLWSDGAETGGS